MQFRPFRIGGDAQQGGPLRRAQHALVAVLADQFDAGQAALAQEGQHAWEVQRRPVCQAQHQAPLIGGEGLVLATQRGGGHATTLQECGIEAAQAVVAGCQRDVGHRQRGFGQQLLGQQQAMGGVDLSGCRAQMLDEQPLQLARAEPDALGEICHRLLLQEAPLDQGQGALHGLSGECLLGLGCQFRAAAQARPVAGRSGRGGGRVVGDVARLRRWRRAHRAAVDASAAHGGEEHAVEACVAGQAGAVAGGGVEGEGGVHGASLGGCGWGYSPDSDMDAERGGLAGLAALHPQRHRQRLNQKLAVRGMAGRLVAAVGGCRPLVGTLLLWVGVDLGRHAFPRVRAGSVPRAERARWTGRLWPLLS